MNRSAAELAASKPWAAEYFLRPACPTLEAVEGELSEKFGPVRVLLVGVCLASGPCVRLLQMFFTN